MRRKGAKLVVTGMAVGALITAMGMTVYAGEWKQDTTGWWYQNTDGTYPVNKWEWLDGNQDGVAESYYFDGNGYMLANVITPDGYRVSESGAWIDGNGNVQTKVVAVQAGETPVVDASEKSQYTVKRLSKFTTKKVEGGVIIGCYDVTDVDQRDPNAEYRYKESKNFKVDMKLFVPDTMDWPDALVEVELDGETIISITPVWIDSANYNYGNFGDPDIYGRQEWREFEYSDPERAAELRKQLNEEAKQRAFAKYPNMIVDYSD